MGNPLLADKVVLISGGTRGLGAGIARAAVREGAAAVGGQPYLAPYVAAKAGSVLDWDQQVFGGAG